MIKHILLEVRRSFFFFFFLIILKVTQNATFTTPTNVDLLINNTFTSTFAFGQVSFFLDAQKKLWAVGNNGVGQLGEENNPIRSSPVKNAILANTNMKSVVGSTSMTVYLSGLIN